MSKILLIPLVGLVVMVNGCQRQAAHQDLARQLQAPDRSTKVLAVYMPWFGDGSHEDVGYSSQDPKVLRRQIEQARSLGISAFVVDWYGDRQPFLDRSFALLQQAAGETGFQVALMYNEAEDGDAEASDDALQALDKAYRDYFGPQAPNRNAYLTYDGRPVIFVFPKQGHADWSRIRQHVDAWPTPPLLFYKDQPKPEFASVFDGYYAWVHPGPEGWAADGSNWGKQYLEAFYSTMRENHPDKISVGAAWPGFDDREARWSLNRHMDNRCGKTLDDTLRLYRRYYDDAHPLPFLLIETWNDYEEGTAIERPKSATCPG